MDGLTSASPGATLRGRYEILREIGRGEYSIVYEALDAEREERIALKQLVPPAAIAALVGERLELALPVVRELDPRGVVCPYDVFEQDGALWIAMQRVEGEDLVARVAASGGLPPDDVAAIGAEVAEALSDAHRRGLLHRDVKPRNLLLAADAVRLTDFGCARLECQALLRDIAAPAHTVGFLSPEAVAGEPCDARSDVYSLGMTLYYALVGQEPERAGPGLPPAPLADGYHPRQVMSTVPGWLDEIVACGTRAEPGERFATAEELAAALDDRARSRAHRQSDGPRLLEVCVLCRQPGTLGRAVCPHCEDQVEARADTLVLIDPGEGSSAQRREMIHRLTGQHPESPAVRRTARGDRPLVRLSRRQAWRIAQRLASHGLGARLVTADLAWTLLPAWLHSLALGVLLGGFGVAAAGYVLCCVAGVFGAAMILWAGHRWVQADSLIENPGRHRLPAALTRRVAEVLAEMEEGEARKLLVEALRLSRDVRERLEEADAPDYCEAALTRAQLASCEAARQLAALDPLLSALQLHGEHRFEPPPRMLEGRSLLETARARLVQALLEATATFSHFRSADMLDAAELVDELGRAESQLRDETDLQRDIAKDALAIFPGIS